MRFKIKSEIRVIEGKVNSLTKYSYDGEKLVQEITYDISHNLFNTHYKYGKPISKYSNSNSYTRTLYTYDDLDRVIKIEEFNEKILRSRSIFNYDNMGIKTEKAEFYSYDGELDGSADCNYDENNKLILETWLNLSGSQEIGGSKKVYDDKGNFIRDLDMNSGKISTECAYDKENNLKELVRYDDDGKIESIAKFSYLYDENKNWTKQIIFLGEYPTEDEFIKRELIYS